MPGYPTSCLSNALHAARADAARGWRACRSIARSIVRVPLARRIVSTTGRHQFYTVRIVDGVGGARLQGVGRHHQHGARGRLHRDPRADRHRRSGRDRGREAVLMHRPSTLHARAAVRAARLRKGDVQSLARVPARKGRCCWRFIAAPGDRTAAAGSVNWHTTSATYAARGVQVVADRRADVRRRAPLHRRDGPAVRHPGRRERATSLKAYGVWHASASTPGTSRGRRCS